MSEQAKLVLNQLISQAGIDEIDIWVNKYPSDQKQSAVMAALRVVQEEKGFLAPEYMDAVAAYLDMPAIAVYEVATFYSMYVLKPEGRHTIHVCNSISCKLKGSDTVIEYLEQKLGVPVGQTTTDKRFTLKAAACLAACCGAPMMQINKEYHENLTPDAIDRVLEQYS